MHYFYVLRSEKSGRLYTGQTSDLKRRVDEHLADKTSYTSKDKPWKLVYYEAYLSEFDSKSRERSVKNHGNVLALLKKRIKHSLEGT